MAEKAIHLGGEATADAIVSAVDTMYSEHTFNEKDFALKHNDAEIAMDSNFAAQSFWKDVRVRFFRKKSAVLGLILVVFIVLLAAFGPGMNEYTYSGQELSQKNFAPRVQVLENFGIFNGDEKMSTTTGSKTVNAYVEKGKEDVYYWFGSDTYGRDIWTRTWEGARVSLIIAVAAAIIDMVIGMSYGLISGYFGGKVDMVMMRIVDIIYSLPDMLMVVLLSVVLREVINVDAFPALQKIGTNMISMFIVFALLYWTGMARMVRGQILTVKQNEYILAARVSGAKDSRIIRRHILPNIVSVIIIAAALQIPSAIFTESFLSFIGLGVQAPMPSLGSLANEARAGITQYPYKLLFPAGMICLITLAFNLLGDGLRDAFDPKLRR